MPVSALPPRSTRGHVTDLRPRVAPAWVEACETALSLQQDRAVLDPRREGRRRPPGADLSRLLLVRQHRDRASPRPGPAARRGSPPREPNLSFTESRATSSGPPQPSNGSGSCTAPSSTRLPTASPSSVSPGPAPAARPCRAAPGRRRGSCGCRRWPGRGVWEQVARVKSPNRSRSVIVRPDPVGAAHPPGDPVDDGDEDGVEVGRGAGSAPRALCDPIDRRRRPTSTGRGSRLWARACRCRPEASPSMATRASSLEPGHLPTVTMPRPCSLAAVFGPTPTAAAPGAGGGSRARRRAARPAGRRAWPPPLATLARNLVRATPTVIARPTSRAPLAAGRRRCRPATRRCAAARRRRGTPRRSTGPRPAASCRSNTAKTAFDASV